MTFQPTNTIPINYISQTDTLTHFSYPMLAQDPGVGQENTYFGLRIS
jgi:hypothetical protein